MPDTEAIVAEFQAELDALARACEGRPDEEVRRLWQIALERESLVAVAYRRDIIGRRVAGMPVDDRVREVVARAIRWAWRDEEMHALWIRGILLREGRRSERAAAWKTTVEGRIAGWTSSRQAHYRWSEAPVKRTVAEALELGGRLTGRIPEAAGSELHFQSFRDWCAFSVGAEKTAELAWARMAALGRDPAAGVSEEDAVVFARITEDEVRHGRMFGVFAASFDAHDRLVPGVDAEGLEAALGAIGQRFLRAPSEGHAAWRNPLGKGARVVVREGERVDAVLEEVLRAVDVDALVGPGKSVALKTSFMLGVDRADPSPVVSLELLDGLVAALVARGCTVTVIDSQNIYDRFHQRRTVPEVARYLGVGSAGYPLLDAQDDQVEHAYLRGIGAGTVCAVWRDADVRIVLGKLRSHPVDRAYLSLDVVEGLGGRHDAFTFSDRKADRHTALLAVADALPPDLALLDAFSDVPDGLTGMMGCRHPLQPRRLYASTDAVSLDVVAARHLDADPDRMLLGAAFDWFGDPRDRLVVDGVDTPIAGWRGPAATVATSVLASLALPVWDHASARGALFVPEVDIEAFPPVDDPGAPLIAARRLAMRLVETGARTAPAEGLLPTETLELPGGRVRLHRSGSGPTLVCLHGYPENLQIFTRLTRALDGVEVVAFDWPGQGASERRVGPTGPSASAEQLIEVLDGLGLDRVTLVATDMGAHPALVAASRFPTRVERVVVMNALLFGDGPTSWEIALMRRSGLNRAAFRLTPSVVWRRCLATFVDDRLPEAHLDDMWSCFRQREVREHLIALCDATEAAFTGLPEDYWQIRAPVLVLWGTREAHFPMEQGERLAGLLPQARFERVDGGTHWMVWSHAERIADRIQRFLEET
jgi:pimeloyl-ACP methyl ester carboxylesterase/uncharacterized protein (DUF362 family)